MFLPAAVPSVAVLVNFNGFFKFLRRKIRPVCICKPEFRVSRLPKEIIAEPHIPARTNHKIHRRQSFRIQAAFKKACVYILRRQFLFCRAAQIADMMPASPAPITMMSKFFMHSPVDVQCSRIHGPAEFHFLCLYAPQGWAHSFPPLLEEMVQEGYGLPAEGAFSFRQQPYGAQRAV